MYKPQVRRGSRATYLVGHTSRCSGRSIACVPARLAVTSSAPLIPPKAGSSLEAVNQGCSGDAAIRSGRRAQVTRCKIPCAGPYTQVRAPFLATIQRGKARRSQGGSDTSKTNGGRVIFSQLPCGPNFSPASLGTRNTTIEHKYATVPEVRIRVVRPLTYVRRHRPRSCWSLTAGSRQEIQPAELLRSRRSS